MRRIPLVVAAVVAVLGLLLVHPETAGAATASANRVAVIQPGSATAAGTPMVPPSQLQTSGNVGHVSNYMAGLMWAAPASTGYQSILNGGFDALTGGPQTGGGNGRGLTTSQNPWCSAAYVVGGGSWANGLGLTRTVTVLASGVVTQNDCEQGSYGVIAELCMKTDGTLQQTSGSTATTGNITNNCPAAFGVGTVWVAASMAPTAGALQFVTDGFTVTNSAYAEEVATRLVVSVTKTCRPSSGADVTVTASGNPGTGVAPAVSCPAGTYTVSQRIFSHILGNLNGFARTLSQTGLTSGAYASFPNCLGPSLVCDMWVAINGIRCALDQSACRTWQGNPGATCHWGSYTMPVADCAALAECYRVPLDSLNTSPTAPTGCGIDRGATPVMPPAPVQDGRVISGTPVPSSTPSPTQSQGQPTIVVNVPTPTVIVNVPQPTVNVTVNVPQPTVNVTVNNPTPIVNVNVPRPEPCVAEDASTGAGAIRAFAASAGADPITPHTDPQGLPAFDLISSGSVNETIANELRVNHGKYAARYVISKMRIASAKSDWEWRTYSPISNSGDYQHNSHVHISYGGTGGDGCTTGGGSTAPGPVDIPQGEGSDCWSSSSAGWNPLAWVYTPANCLLKKATTPTPGKLGQAGDEIGDALDGLRFSAWTDALGDLGGAFQVDSFDCKGPAMSLGYPFNRTFYPASSCTEPMAGLAAISRIGTAALLIVTGAWSCLRLLASGIGYGGIASGGGDS